MWSGEELAAQRKPDTNVYGFLRLKQPPIRTEWLWFLPTKTLGRNGVVLLNLKGGWLFRRQIFSQQSDSRFPLTEKPREIVEQHSPLNTGKGEPTFLLVKTELWLWIIPLKEIFVLICRVYLSTKCPLDGNKTTTDVFSKYHTFTFQRSLLQLPGVSYNLNH